MARSSRRLRIVTDSSRNPDGSEGSKSHDPDMAALVDRAAAGEREAFDELVRLTHRDAFGLAVRLTGNEEDARDVVQDAYLRAYRSIGRFRGEARFSHPFRVVFHGRGAESRGQLVCRRKSRG